VILSLQTPTSRDNTQAYDLIGEQPQLAGETG
jgi:hypothetical protein